MSISVSLGSWADPEYEGVLYPKGVGAANRLRAYAECFNRVEVNSTYYAAPRRKTVTDWDRQTPAKFTFDIKLHRAFSQSPEKAARDGGLLEYFFNGLQPLIRSRKLGAFLLVAAPSFAPEKNHLEELARLAEKLKPHRLAVELRHRGWVTGKHRSRTLDFFRESGLVWVCLDLPRIADSTLMPSMDEVTNPALAYLRLHGRNKSWLKATSAAERHAHEYQPRELREIATRVRWLADEAEHVQVVANNHARDFAPRAALALQQLLAPRRTRTRGAAS